MRVCLASDLHCISPLLGVAVNSGGKPRLLWDGRHANRRLHSYKFCMETLQREARALFERSLLGCDAGPIQRLPTHGDP